MKTEAVRKMDELGRIIIPPEMRSALCWDNKTKISISKQGEQLVLQTNKGSCFICGTEDELKLVFGKHICQKCIDEISQ